jgi:hypothetical protein
VLVSENGWGRYSNQEQHVGLDYKRLNKGYFESGRAESNFLMLLTKGFIDTDPISCLNSLDNIAIKLSFILNLGI